MSATSTAIDALDHVLDTFPTIAVAGSGGVAMSTMDRSGRGYDLNFEAYRNGSAFVREPVNCTVARAAPPDPL